MGNHHYAIKDFKEAIRIDPSSSLAYFYLGTSRLKFNQVKDAIDDF